MMFGAYLDLLFRSFLGTPGGRFAEWIEGSVFVDPAKCQCSLAAMPVSPDAA
jgi:hypothetical protein